MSLMSIRLELARTPEFPEGSSAHGYEFIAPLDGTDHIDAEAWKGLREKCKVVHFWGDAEHQHGLLRRVGKGWRFDYDESDDDDDEPFFKLDRHPIRPGAYVSVTDAGDGEQYPFRVISVIPEP
jgi:hypothetical protein